ncbi:hypothetical protein ACFQMB_05570 [Pseudobowmanella zhangzhouensis]|uniref:hypothetical protein n=1 Tax=Pseudobowmanella zhangzhouensis TaxID=1537679 RepID=UPI00360B4BF7
MLLLISYIVWAKYRIVTDQLIAHKLYVDLQKQRQQLQHSNQELATNLETQRLMQDELVETRKLSSLGMMVAGVAHELNTPIGATLITITTLEQRLSAMDELVRTGLTKSALEEYLQGNRQGFELTLRNLQRCAEILQSFKRLAIDRATLTLETFALADNLRDLLLSITPKIKRRGLACR